MAEWRAATLGELTVNFDARRRPVKSSERSQGRYPYYGASGVVDRVDGYLFDGDYLLISEDGENLRARSTPIAFMASGRFWVNNHAHVVQANASADTRFLGYLLSATDVMPYLSGSAQPKLSRASMDAVAVRVPPAAEQRAIADVLGALDDKIAANTRLATTAEELAIAVLSAVDASVPLSEIVSVSRSMVSPETLTDPVVAHFSLPAFDSANGPDLVAPALIKSGKFRVDRPAVLLSKLNPRFPRVWDLPSLPNEPALASTEFVVLHPRSCTTAVLWALVSQPRFGVALEGMVAGTSGSHQRVKPAEILATPVGDSRTLSPALTERVTTLGRVAQSARAERLTLAATRDTLLPALTSGALRVRDALDAVKETAS